MPTYAQFEPLIKLTGQPYPAKGLFEGNFEIVPVAELSSGT
jgi:hypothetical protein